MRRLKENSRGQVGIEYMMIVGFITFAIMSVIVLAFFYSGQIKERIKTNQVESFANQLIDSSESVFYAGEPSKTTISLSLPANVESVTIATNSVVITTNVGSGKQNIREFPSNVELQGTITPEEGIKKITLEAKTDHVLITQN